MSSGVMSDPPPTPVIPTNRPPTNPQTEYSGSIACMAGFRLLAMSRRKKAMRQYRRFDDEIRSIRPRSSLRPSSEELPFAAKCLRHSLLKPRWRSLGSPARVGGAEHAIPELGSHAEVA